MAARTNIEAFEAGLRADVGDVREEVEARRPQAVAMKALEDLVMGTRVDEGRARGGWDVTLVTPTDTDPERLDPHGSEAIAEGMRAIAAHTGGQVIWIANAVQYIGFLEDLDGMLEGAYQATLTWLDSQGLAVGGRP